MDPSTKLSGATDERLAFLQWNSDDQERLSQLASILAPHLDELIGDWHTGILQHPGVAPLLPTGQHGQHLARLQKKYFQSLFLAPRDASYFADRERIGLVHKKVSLEPFWYLAAYSRFFGQIQRFLSSEEHPKTRVLGWMETLEKAICLDISLALDAYHRAQTEEIVASNEKLQALSDDLAEKNRQLYRQVQKAQEGARLKREFLSRISHELRTPLHGVLGYADLIADGIQGPVNQEQRESLGKIRMHGERLVEMVDQLIDAAKLSAAGNIDIEPFSPDQAVATLAAEGYDTATTKGLQFIEEVPPRLPAVLGDPKELVRALRHVLRNAVQFTTSGSVRFAVQEERDELCFTVGDSGPGIPLAQREQIFEPFFQGDAGDTGTCRGVGLGLTLARETAERMGGHLELRNSSPEGSTFVLRLPLAPVTSTSPAAMSSDQ